MNIDTRRTAVSAITRLQSIAKGVGAFYLVPIEWRADMTSNLKEITGADIGIERSVQRIFLGERVIDADKLADSDVMLLEDRLMAWARGLEGANIPMQVDRWPVGADLLCDRLGYVPERIRTLWRCLGWMSLKRDGATIWAASRNSLPTVGYRAQSGLKWENGIVTIRQGTLPQTIRTSMVGHRVDRLVGDAIVGDSIVRSIPQACHREERLRIITTDADRWSVLERNRENEHG